MLNYVCTPYSNHVCLNQDAAKLFITKEMLLLLPFCLYMGFELSFWSGVYGPCLAFTKAFETDSKSLSGLHGIMIGDLNM